MRYFLLSKVVDVKFAFKRARAHWKTESNNWEADMTYQEDHHKVIDEKLALAVAGLRRFALNVATASDIKDTRRGILQRAAMGNKVLLGLVINHKANLINPYANIDKVRKV